MKFNRQFNQESKSMQFIYPIGTEVKLKKIANELFLDDLPDYRRFIDGCEMERDPVQIVGHLIYNIFVEGPEFSRGFTEEDVTDDMREFMHLAAQATQYF